MREKNPSWSYPTTLFQQMKNIPLAASEIYPPMGGGQSYGDANFLNKKFTQVEGNLIGEINQEASTIELGGGVTIKDALNHLAKFRLTLRVIPGTMRATIGGCIASDIHGKNTHKFGAFSDSVQSFKIKVGSTIQNVTNFDDPLWKLTIGGQGTTGLIVSATIKVMPLKSHMLESKVVPTRNLEDIFQILEELSPSHDFAVAWVDGLTPGLKERGFIEFCNEVQQTESQIQEINSQHLYKSNYPRIKAVNRLTIGAFNLLRHFLVFRQKNKTKLVNRWNYMFPMGTMGNWNYLFGKKGYHEVQFSCDTAGLPSAIALLRKIIKEQKIFLIGIKIMNAQQNGYISFPGQKWSIAINFPASKMTPMQVGVYYDEIIEFKGKVNLTKDWVLTKKQFYEIYPEAENLKSWRQKSEVRVKSNFTLRVDL